MLFAAQKNHLNTDNLFIAFLNHNCKSIIKTKQVKVRESDMPDEQIWAEFFQIGVILSELQINSQIHDLVEIGTGYGTFTIPIANRIRGKLFGFDIEKEMLNCVAKKLKNERIDNVILEQRDILTQKTGLADNSIDYVVLFNILHHDSSVDFFNEAHRILKSKGKVGVIHWRSDISTPRGPDLIIRPKPEMIIQLLDKEKFTLEKGPFILEPYHYGLIVSRR